jgi:hypothetical protein
MAISFCFRAYDGAKTAAKENAQVKNQLEEGKITERAVISNLWMVEVREVSE